MGDITNNLIGRTHLRALFLALIGVVALVCQSKDGGAVPKLGQQAPTVIAHPLRFEDGEEYKIVPCSDTSLYLVELVVVEDTSDQGVWKYDTIYTEVAKVSAKELDEQFDNTLALLDSTIRCVAEALVQSEIRNLALMEILDTSRELQESDKP